MSKEYIKAALQKVLEDKNFPSPLNAAMAATWITGNMKGENLKVLKLSEGHPLCDYFTFATAKTKVQLEAMRDEILFNLKSFDIIPFSQEGSGESLWILLDFGDFFTHLLTEEGRALYNLDDLYKNEQSIEIPQYFYFEEPVTEEKREDKKDKEDKYF